MRCQKQKQQQQQRDDVYACVPRHDHYIPVELIMQPSREKVVIMQPSREKVIIMQPSREKVVIMQPSREIVIFASNVSHDVFK